MKPPEKPPLTYEDIFSKLLPSSKQNTAPADLFAKIASASTGPTYKGEYLHWDDLRRREPPPGLTHEILWASLKLHRAGMSQDLSLWDPAGRPFRLALVDPAPEMLRFIDMQAGGTIPPGGILPREFRNRAQVVTSLIEEATTSSQVEGASTTRRVAKELIRSGRPPRNRGERMILNNYATMGHVRSLKSSPLTPALIFDLHRRITEDTIPGQDVGRFRRTDEPIAVVEHNTNALLYSPPPADQLPARMEALCAFANGDSSTPYLHPVVRSIILHFWLSFDHPFVDGNGRCARTLFYWSMLRHGYWLAEYLSISRLIHQAQAQYARAFLLTETDENDLTYFVLYHLDLITRAIEALRAFVLEKTQQRIHLESELEGLQRLNHRQRALIAHALRNPGFEYTVASHQTRQDVTPQTARMDLYDLVDNGLLRKHKIGRTWHFRAVSNLEDKLAGKEIQ